MSLFTTSSKRISENLELLERYCEDYNRLVRCINTSILDDSEEKVTRQNIEEVNAKFKSLSKSIKDKIKAHTDDISNYKEDRMNYKVMKLHLKAHTRKLTDLINRYRELQFIQKRNEEDRLKMLFKIANRGCSEEEVAESVKSKDSRVNIASHYALGQNSKKLCLAEAERRNKELLKIRDMAKELDELCRIISETVSIKALEIDNFADEQIDIEANMKKANVELEATLRRKIRRKKFIRWLLFILFVCVMIYASYKCIKDDWLGRWKKRED
ncbi:Syntaxin-2 [Nosema granulosis]|uniref:Syntaxin-2 n=1 Tax=Nosema granulosis TaxID=83296 RepID=A0A9P6H0K6_9MICR|nr:Syntaxin-2 [Nosema granulosis]